MGTEIINRLQTEIKGVCERFHVKELSLFGSALTDRFDDDSDMDFLVRLGEGFEQGIAERFFGLQESLEAICGRQVDLVSYDAIRNPFFKNEVDKTRQVLYVV
jgi:predicted nucleotidyltransferase